MKRSARRETALQKKKYQVSNSIGGYKMARIAGVDLPREKRVEIGLTYIYGIGRPTADLILKTTGINPDT